MLCVRCRFIWTGLVRSGQLGHTSPRVPRGSKRTDGIRPNHARPILRDAKELRERPEKPARPFVHLRVHSAYSLLEGALPIGKIVAMR